MADLVNRDDPDVGRGHRAALGVERGQGDGRRVDVPVLIPHEVGLAGALDIELHAPLEAHLRGARIGGEVEAYRHADFPPPRERAAHRVEERRLEIRGRPRRQPHADGIRHAVVPAAQHRVGGDREDVAQVGDARAGANAAARVRAGELVHVAGRGGRCRVRRRSRARREAVVPLGQRGDGFRHGHRVPRGWRRAPPAAYRVPHDRQYQHRDDAGDERRHVALGHARNMQTRAAAPLALASSPAYDCGPHMLGR